MIRAIRATICGTALGCVAVTGCSQDVGEELAMRDSLGADTTVLSDSVASPIPSPTDTLRVQQPLTSVDSVRRPPRATTSRPAPPVRTDTGRKAVHGRVELALDEKTYAPGDYLRVQLVGGGGTLETWTNRNGEFSFSDVPPGTREIVFLTPDKIGRVVFRQAVDLGAEPVARLAVVHIPIDSIKRPARKD